MANQSINHYHSKELSVHTMVHKNPSFYKGNLRFHLGHNIHGQNQVAPIIEVYFLQKDIRQPIFQKFVISFEYQRRRRKLLQIQHGLIFLGDGLFDNATLARPPEVNVNDYPEQIHREYLIL